MGTDITTNGTSVVGRAIPPKRNELGKRSRRALVYATKIHAGQMRKGGDIPYVSHLLAVSALVIEDGGSEDGAIAALLHDTVEDQGGAPRLRKIRKRFGMRVARIVEGCSDTDVQPKPPWRDRKNDYIRHLKEAPPEVIRVSLADKLHNARSILGDYRLEGERPWSRFPSPDAGPLWYYRALATEFRLKTSSPMVDELEHVITELERLHTAALAGGKATA